MADTSFAITRDGDRLDVSVEGNLDAQASPGLERALEDELDDVAELVVDLEKVAYVSSMGLRLLLAVQKRMFKQGSMVVRGANGDVRELFEATGFSEILTLA